MSFAAHLRKNIERVLLEVNYKINHRAFIFFNYIVKKSPHVGEGPYVSGQFINNWFPAVNGFDSSITSATDPDGKGSVARIESVVKNNSAFLRRDGFVSLSNNLDYAKRVEYLGWPKGHDPKTGWNWTGKRIIYAPVQKSMLYMRTVK